jgi:hypothetical protein
MDTGKVAVRGYGAGAIKYVALRGYVPNPPTTTLVACLATRGFGIANTHRKALRGFVANPGGGGGGTGVFYIFGGAWLR